VSEANLYAFLFGIKRPFVHVVAYFVSVLRQRIANFEAKPEPPAPPERGRSGGSGRQRDDRDLHQRSAQESARPERVHGQRVPSSPARYGVILDASLITGIDPPPEVESALAAINTAHNQVSSDISLAQAAADQRVVQSRRAVEIETLRAQAEVEPVKSLAAELGALHNRWDPIFWAPTCATCGWRFTTKRSRFIWRREMNDFLVGALMVFVFGCLSPSPCFWALPCSSALRRGAGANRAGLHAVRESDRHSG
jgi:hypothetical protein